MFKRILISLVVCLVGAPAMGDMVDDLARLPELVDAEISPTGEYMAILKEENDKRIIAVLEFPAMELINVVDFPGRSEVGQFWWVNDERLLISVAVDWGNREEDVNYGELYAVNADGKKGKYLFGLRGEQGSATKSRTAKVRAEYASGTLAHPRWQDPKTVLIRYVEWSRGFRNVTAAAKLDVYTGRITDRVLAPTANAQMFADASGEIRFSSFRDDDDNFRTYFRDLETGRWDEYSVAAYGESQITPVFLDKDEQLYVSEAVDDGPEGIYVIDLANGKKKRVYQHEYVDYDNLLRDFTGEVYGVTATPGLVEQYFIKDHPNSQLRVGLAEAFPNAFPIIVSQTHDFNLTVVMMVSDQQTPEYFVYDRDKGTLQSLMDALPWIEDGLLSKMEPIELEARDGETLHGYLTVPRGAKKDNLPLVIVPHGGPHGPRDSWGYQFLEGFIPASGYAMLQINFRGSGGYGMRFERLGHKNWPSTMQDDLTDAVRWAIDQGIADPDRICLWGWSYGGYAAAMSLVREPDLYKCSVAGAGPFDLEVMYRQGDFAEGTRWGTKYLDTVIGPTKEDRYQASPVAHVDKINVPMLLIHGDEDQRVPIENAYSFQDAMKKAGKPVPRLVKLKNEAHTPRKEENLRQVFRESAKFIEKHIGPGVKPKKGA